MRSLLCSLATRHVSRCSLVQSATARSCKSHDGVKCRAKFNHRSSSFGSSLSPAAAHTSSSSSSSPTSTSTSASDSSSRNSSKSSNGREHPPFPRVGVAAVLFKPPPPRRRRGQQPGAPPMPNEDEPSVLLIQRAKPPNKGMWSFPGGALELGEGIVAGAERELSEEVPGLRFEQSKSVAGALAGGVAFAAADSIHYDDNDDDDDDDNDGDEKNVDGKARNSSRALPRFHWAIIEVAAVAAAADSNNAAAADNDAPPATADDASAARWVGALSELRALEAAGVVTSGCFRVAEEAVARFRADLGLSTE